MCAYVIYNIYIPSYAFIFPSRGSPTLLYVFSTMLTDKPAFISCNVDGLFSQLLASRYTFAIIPAPKDNPRYSVQQCAPNLAIYI